MTNDTLSQLPVLLSSARELLAASDPRGDPDAAALLATLEECVVEAHRLVLRRRMAVQAAAPRALTTPDLRRAKGERHLWLEA